MPKKGPKSKRIIYRPCSTSGPICALTLSHTAHYLGRYAQKHELKRAARITIEQSCGTHGLGLCRRYWPFCGWAHLVKVVYMSSKILKLTVGLCELSQAKKWYFVTKIVLTYCEKKMFKWSRKTCKIWSWRPRIFKIFEIIRTIYSNIKRSEQFLVTECFFNLFLEVSHI
jgi:hypothetical protein